MDRKITIQIGERKYNLTAHNDEQEQVYRKAAAAINARLKSFSQSNPGCTMLELMCLAALNESVCRFDLLNELTAIKAESEKLGADLKSYLASTEK